jgi:hypothetical protein
LCPKSVLFVNFDGAMMVHGSSDDAPSNTTQFPEWAGEFPPYGDDPAAREATLQAVRDLFSQFDLGIVGERPAEGPYSMIMVGPKGQGGYASMDCGDSHHRNVGFAGLSASDGGAGMSHARLIAHEAGHTFGLDHVSDSEAIMGSGMSFNDHCSPLLADSCPGVHQRHCPAGEQNAVQELLDAFGPADPDLESFPDAWILTPQDGDTFPVRSVVSIAFEAVDDDGIHGVSLFLDGALRNTLMGDPYTWEIEGLEEGRHEVYAVAADVDCLETTTDSVTFWIGEAGDDDSEGTEDHTGDDDAGTDGDGDDSDTDGVDQAGDDEDEGCGCTGHAPANHHPPLVSALLLLGLAACRRRV